MGALYKDMFLYVCKKRDELESKHPPVNKAAHE